VLRNCKFRRAWLVIKAFKCEPSIWVSTGVSLQATGLVKLALRLGLKPDITNSFINKELLYAENKAFVEDDELKDVLRQLDDLNNVKKLGEEKKSSGGFLGKLFGK
jgi:hypothetical protein